MGVLFASHSQLVLLMKGACLAPVLVEEPYEEKVSVTDVLRWRFQTNLN